MAAIKYPNGSGGWNTIYNLSGMASHVHGNITNDGKVGTTEGKVLMTSTGGTVIATDMPSTSAPLDSYPVGSIYMSISNTSPATLFGGTWSALPTGKFLRIGTGGATGGSDTHLHSTTAVALTVAQMPPHGHRAKSPTTATGGGVKSGFDVWRTGGAFNNDYMIENTGSGSAHGHGNTGSASNVPAYYEVYAWRRTA